IAGAITSSQIRTLASKPHSSATSRNDRGAVSPDTRLDHVVMMLQPSADQQTDLDQLLADQQNPSSKQFHKWLTPEQFGDRYGLSTSDQSKIVAWLASEGIAVKESSRARNWIAFNATAAQISKTFHTSIHRYNVKGVNHFSN